MRYDENLTSFFITGWGNGQVCEVCQAQEQGLPPPEPTRYPVGSRIPRFPGSDKDIPICGLCRQALTEDLDRGKPVRIRPEMLDPGEKVERGCYVMCPDCLKQWRPRVLAYLKRLCRVCNELDCEEPDHSRMLPLTATERQVVGNLLV